MGHSASVWRAAGTIDERIPLKSIQGYIGGKNSGKQRRQKAERWHAHALELASQFPTEEYSQSALATEILNRWKAADIDPPLHEALKEQISTWRKSGVLPSRRTKRKGSRS